jgi:hypothetical protein
MRVHRYILRDLSEYATLAYVVFFEVPQAHGQNTKSFTDVQAPPSMALQHNRITYIALVKICMSKLTNWYVPLLIPLIILLPMANTRANHQFRYPVWEKGRRVL